MDQCVGAGLGKGGVETVILIRCACADLARHSDLVGRVDGEMQGDGAVTTVDVGEGFCVVA